MKTKEIYIVRLEGPVPVARVFANNHEHALKVARKITEQPRSRCVAISYAYTVYHSNTLKETNAVYKVEIDHAKLNMEACTYYIISNGIINAGKQAMRYHLQLKKDYKVTEKRGFFIRAITDYDTIYTK